MAWQIDRYQCAACGGLHDLHNDGPVPVSLVTTYAYVCPETGREVQFREFTLYRKADKPPDGAVRIRRLDSP
jgi:hypothetical protein